MFAIIKKSARAFLQAASHHANDRFAEMCAHANSERALEQSLHIRLYIPFDGMEHIKAGSGSLNSGGGACRLFSFTGASPLSGYVFGSRSKQRSWSMADVKCDGSDSQPRQRQG